MKVFFLKLVINVNLHITIFFFFSFCGANHLPYAQSPSVLFPFVWGVHRKRNGEKCLKSTFCKLTALWQKPNRIYVSRTQIGLEDALRVQRQTTSRCKPLSGLHYEACCHGLFLYRIQGCHYSFQNAGAGRYWFPWNWELGSSLLIMRCHFTPIHATASRGNRASWLYLNSLMGGWDVEEERGAE